VESHSVAGVIHVFRSEPVAGREIMTIMKASARGHSHDAHVGRAGGEPSGTRVNLLAMSLLLQVQPPDASGHSHSSLDPEAAFRIP
jgi:hypothetical protein